MAESITQIKVYIAWVGLWTYVHACSREEPDQLLSEF